MKRIAQAQDTYNDDSVEQSVMLSPRTLLTGPRQIVRLERQYRSLSEDLQNALENLNRTKDSYVSALHAFEQAEEYIRQLGPKVRMAMMYLNSARSNHQYLAQAEGMVQSIVSGVGSAPASATSNSAAGTNATPAQGKGSTSSNHSMERLAQWEWMKNVNEIMTKTKADAEAAEKARTGTAQTTAPTPEQQQQQAMVTQQINALQSQLGTFVNEMQRRYGLHKQRAVAMEGQYNMSKAAYARVRAQFFQMQTEISSLTSNLSGWNERLSEYYAPSGGEA